MLMRSIDEVNRSFSENIRSENTIKLHEVVGKSFRSFRFTLRVTGCEAELIKFKNKNN